jgi:hypothetical protein
MLAVIVHTFLVNIVEPNSTLKRKGNNTERSDMITLWCG